MAPMRKIKQVNCPYSAHLSQQLSKQTPRQRAHSQHKAALPGILHTFASRPSQLTQGWLLQRKSWLLSPRGAGGGRGLLKQRKLPKLLQHLGLITKASLNPPYTPVTLL